LICFLGSAILLVMSEIVFLNGDFVASDVARIDPGDRGLLLGDGLFETMRCFQGRAFALDAHWERLSHGAGVLQISLPLNCQELGQHIAQLLSLNQLDQGDAGVRFTLTRGVGQRGISLPSNVKPTILMTCFSISEKPLRAVSLMISDVVINEHSPLAACKTLGYAENIIARQQAQSQGYDDALLCNTKGQIVSASSANVFLVIDQQLHTPALSCGALPGIMRQQILRIAKQQDIPIHERVILPEDLQKAEEAFITNSLLPLLPISRIDQHSLKAPTPGTTTALFQHRLAKRARHPFL